MAVLLEKADSQGFLTTDDVLEALPDADDAMDQLEDVFMWLHTAGVEVFGDKPGDEARIDEDEMDDDEDDGFDLSGV